MNPKSTIQIREYTTKRSVVWLLRNFIDWRDFDFVLVESGFCSAFAGLNIGNHLFHKNERRGAKRPRYGNCGECGSIPDYKEYTL